MSICLLLWCTFHRCNTEVSHTTNSEIKLATSASYCKDSYPPFMWNTNMASTADCMSSVSLKHTLCVLSLDQPPLQSERHQVYN